MNSLHSSALNGSSDSAAESVNSSLNRSEAAQRFSSEASNPEVLAIKRRRTISPAEKRRILQAYDRCKSPAERGAVLRRERVYSSMLSNWRKHDRAALATPRRGPKANPAVAQRNRDAQLTREIVRLRRQLERANAIIDVQKKLCTLLGLPTAEEQESKD
jgi:transposase